MVFIEMMLCINGVIKKRKKGFLEGVVFELDVKIVGF